MRFPEYESHDATALAALVRKGELTACELVEAAIERIEARNGPLNAVVHRMDEKARAAARAREDARARADARLPGGPFAGVPILLKDLLAAVAGEPLTSSSSFLRELVPPHDSELVSRLRRAGFLLLGKTNTPELGIMGVTESRLRGPCRNPWHLGHTPGGSSGGAAAAVAAGMVPLAHGGDGGGSIRIPASCCGLFGLKPSRGRNPLGPTFGESWAGLVQEHAITRSVRDSAALLDATAGPEMGGPYAAPPPPRPFLAEVGLDPGRLRIAFTTGSLYGERTHPECRAAVEDAARLLASLGHDVEEARPEFDRAVQRRCYLAVVTVNTARAIDWAGQVMGRRPRATDFEPETWLLCEIGHAMPAPDYQAAIEAMHAGRLAVARFFTRFDLLLTATLAYPPARVGQFAATRLEALQLALLRAAPARRLLDLALESMADRVFEATANTMLFNQTGQPAMSVPLWWNRDGLPIGVQLAARYGEEGLLFRLAAQLETARPWFDRRPPWPPPDEKTSRVGVEGRHPPG